jgi:hypothetical protein
LSLLFLVASGYLGIVFMLEVLLACRMKSGPLAAFRL